MTRIFRSVRDGIGFDILLIGAALLFLVAFAGVPLIYNVLMSFQQVDMFNLGTFMRPLVGFANYAAVVAQPEFWMVARNTLLFVVGSIGGQFVLGFGLALFFARGFPGAATIRGLFLVSWVMPGLVVGDTSAQTPELEQAMRDSGLAHLTAVSGGNVAVVIALVVVVGRAAGLRRGRTRLVVVGLAVAAYVVIARPEPSVVRAAAMAGDLGAVGREAFGEGEKEMRRGRADDGGGGVEMFGGHIGGVAVWGALAPRDEIGGGGALDGTHAVRENARDNDGAARVRSCGGVCRAHWPGSTQAPWAVRQSIW